MLKRTEVEKILSFQLLIEKECPLFSVLSS